MGSSRVKAVSWDLVWLKAVHCCESCYLAISVIRIHWEHCMCREIGKWFHGIYARQAETNNTRKLNNLWAILGLVWFPSAYQAEAKRVCVSMCERKCNVTNNFISCERNSDGLQTITKIPSRRIRTANYSEACAEERDDECGKCNGQQVQLGKQKTRKCTCRRWDPISMSLPEKLSLPYLFHHTLHPHDLWSSSAALC